MAQDSEAQDMGLVWAQPEASKSPAWTARSSKLRAEVMFPITMNLDLSGPPFTLGI
jgi:hypothetical protein